MCINKKHISPLKQKAWKVNINTKLNNSVSMFDTLVKQGGNALAKFAHYQHIKDPCTIAMV